MEMLIRTPDMPGVHQTSDVSEVVPSERNVFSNVLDDSYERGRNYISETQTLLYMNPEENAKKLHMSYNDFIDVVNKCIESGAGIIWDTYQQFIKLKSANPEKYKEAIDEMENINDCSLFSSFRTRLNNLTKNKNLKNKLLDDSKYEEISEYEKPEYKESFRCFFKNILYDNHNCDIPSLINNNDYLEEIAKLRFDLQSINSNFKFDVENCVEYTAHRPDCFYYTMYLNSIAFKVKPYIKKISLTTGNSIYDSIPVVSYKICVDMHKLITWLSTNCKMPDELPEVLEESENVREEYIRSVLGEYPSFSEKIARRIVMEIFDLSYNIQGNWRKFLQKFISSYNKLLIIPDITNLINKANYFSNLSESHNDPGMMKESISANTELFEEIFKFVNDSYNFDDQFVNQLFETIFYDSSSNKSEFIIRQAGTLFKKTFSVFFEDAVLMNFYSNYDEKQHFNKGITFYSYTREFYKSYDIVDLLGKASSITDYNIRDFISTIITEFKSCRNEIYDPAKMSNGEYLFFMYSKISRKVWMDLTNCVILASKLTGMMEQTEPRSNNDEKLYNSISRTISDFNEFVYSTLLNMLTEARFIPRRSSIGCFSWKYEYIPIKKNINFCNEYVRPVVSNDFHKIDKLISDVLKQSENKEPNKCVDDGFIVSYDVADRDKYDLKHNFTMALQRRGLVSLDF